MIRTLQAIFTILIILVSVATQAQVREKKIIPFDLDKRSIGTLPFDERFKLSGFDTQYDSISLSYKINDSFLNKEPNYHGGGSLDLVVDKVTGKAIFPSTPIGPLHPNVLYDFVFSVSKNIVLSKEELEAMQVDIFELVETHFKEVQKIDNTAISAFKVGMQLTLIKYAKSNRIYDQTGNLIDIEKTPLFTNKELQKVLTQLEFDYFALNTRFSETNNEVVRAQENTVKELNNDKSELVFQKLKTALSGDVALSKAFISVLDTPINPIPGVNEKLTVRQYLTYIMDDPYTFLSDVVKGHSKISGNDHQAALSVDLSSVRLLSKIAEKLYRSSITKSNGLNYFDADEREHIKYIKAKLDVIIEKLSDKVERQGRIKAAKNKIPNLLKNAIAKRDITVSEIVEIDMMAEKNAYVGLDAGVGFAFGAANGVFTYQGANFYFRPVNHQTSFKDLQGTDEFLKRFSLYLGIAQIITPEEDQFEDLIAGSSILIGAGFRLTRGFRANIGGLLHYQKDSSPVVNSKKIIVSPTVSLSIDINLVKALGAVGGALNL